MLQVFRPDFFWEFFFSLPSGPYFWLRVSELKLFDHLLEFVELGCFGTYSFKESSSSWCFIMSELEKFFAEFCQPQISTFGLGENIGRVGCVGCAV